MAKEADQRANQEEGGRNGCAYERALVLRAFAKGLRYVFPQGSRYPRRDRAVSTVGMNRRTLLSSALAALGAWLMPWRKKPVAPDAIQAGFWCDGKCVPVRSARDMEADQAAVIPSEDDRRWCWTNQVRWYEEP